MLYDFFLPFQNLFTPAHKMHEIKSQSLIWAAKLNYRSVDIFHTGCLKLLVHITCVSVGKSADLGILTGVRRTYRLEHHTDQTEHCT